MGRDKPSQTPVKNTKASKFCVVRTEQKKRKKPPTLVPREKRVTETERLGS